MTDLAATLAGLADLDWDAIATQVCGDARYADWCHLKTRDETVKAAGYCQCCATVNHRPLARAVAQWTPDANRIPRLLCASCLGSYQANAEDAPELSGTFVMLEAAP